VTFGRPRRDRRMGLRAQRFGGIDLAFNDDVGVGRDLDTGRASASLPVVSLVELIVPLVFANQVSNGVRAGFEQMPARSHQLTGQFSTIGQGLDGDDSLAGLRPLQSRARMDVKLARQVRWNAHLIAFAHGRCHARRLAHRPGVNKSAPTPAKRRLLSGIGSQSRGKAG
jgi:hypothetical protein